ncbi:MAG TPA: helix-turn-helix transcriptional regulator [Accumulibacter sp.]|nr:helix-turn-helix transcriptional regulator [Accumulibacter sp.]HNK51490.1 helix-turn-helix transcriptional regulator [Nitrospira sp.]HND81676.1 helix-turn-helix transcriptional regulator [Accumulibacter sp.]HNH25180.1 helix-turn-helix transcriptional regulator [Accumulibacter sp.]HNI74765.1 helix-turn-helix transcriptional regulator [Accumulibacter sp.]
MTPIEYLDAAREKLGGISEYELAKRLEIKQQQVSAFKLGKANLPMAAIFRLAITLERDPAEVLADLASQWEKNDKKRAFWVGFLSRARVLIAAICILGSSFTAMLDNARGLPGGSAVPALVASIVATVLWRHRKVRIICIMSTQQDEKVHVIPISREKELAIDVLRWCKSVANIGDSIGMPAYCSTTFSPIIIISHLATYGFVKDRSLYPDTLYSISVA